MPPPPPPPPPDPPTPPEPVLAPVLLEKREVHEAAKARAEAAALLAAQPPALPATPAHNTLGETLRDVIRPYAPEGEDIIPIRLEINGAEVGADRNFSDYVLWNTLDTSFTPESFAKTTCDEAGLPATFV
jgi:hypothetical protein